MVPRLMASLLPDADVAPLGERVWGDTSLVLPTGAADSFHQMLSGRCIRARRDGDTASVRIADDLRALPDRSPRESLTVGWTIIAVGFIVWFVARAVLHAAD